METQFNWFQSIKNEPIPGSQPDLAPPPVSFGFSSTSASPKTPDSRGFFTNNSSGNLTALLDDQQSIPLSLTAKDLTLQESKTYMRWYSDILARTNQRTISIADVYQFLSNFKISSSIKDAINRIFSKKVHLINIGEFFALLRVISHALQGQSPSRALIKVQTGVPVPPSILWKKRQKDDNDSDEESNTQAGILTSNKSNPLDIDLFTQFMLTGERPGEKAPQKRLKKLKTVKFSDEVETNYREEFVSPSPASNIQGNSLDYSLPMDQLLSRMNASKINLNTLAVPEDNRQVHSPDPEEKQILRDMEPQMNYFQNLHSVDTILIGGVPANIHVQPNSDFRLPNNMLPQPALLKPNMTGPVQMAQMGLYNGIRLGEADYKAADLTLEGAQRMARLFSPTPDERPKVSLESFTSQMTGEHPLHSDSPVGRYRSISQPNPLHLQSKWGEQNSEFKNPEITISPNHFPDVHSASNSPVPPVPPRASPNTQGRPVPPPPRSRKISNSFSSPNTHSPLNDHQAPPPLPAKIPNVSANSLYQNTQSNSTANILDDLKALQEEVDKIRDLTGGF